jgi:predicted ferric reductase
VQRTSYPSVRAGIRRPVARAVLFGLYGANLLIVTAFFLQAGPSANVLIAVARLFALYSFVTLAFQLVLIARMPWLDRRIGADRMTSIHRWTGFTVLCTLTAHILLVVSGYALLNRHDFFGEFVDLVGTQVAVLVGLMAFTLIVLVGATSVRVARRRLPYEAWHAVHFVTYLAVVLAFYHALSQTTSFAVSAIAQAYLWVLWLGALGSVVVFRFGLPLARNARQRFRVSAVVFESRDVVSVHVTGNRLAALPALPGQFFVWRFDVPGRRFRANPFSLSAAPDGRSLRLTAKAVGAGSAGLRMVRPGTRVFAAGPYGAFTDLNRLCQNVLLIAGGIGITPIRALLEHTPGHLVLIYRVRQDSDAVLLRELQYLAQRRGAVLHVLTGPSSGYVRPPLGTAGIHALVPDVTTRDVFVCGPRGMTSGVITSLHELGVPTRQVHAERFTLAG